MAKTGIIGHRGAAGLALENSHDSIIAALKYEGIDAIEFDVRRTRDGQLVIIHDNHTGRISKEKKLVSLKTLAELQAIELKNGQNIPTLEDIFKLLAGKKTMVIDIKDKNCADQIIHLLDKYPKATVELTSLLYGELEKIHKIRPELPFYVIDMLNPFELVHTARRMHATGISLNKFLMNPLTYWLASRRNLEIRVYTVNSQWIGRLLQKLYPGIVIYTNYPQRFLPQK